MLKFKSGATSICIFVRGIVARGMIYLFIGIKRATTINGVVLIILQIKIFKYFFDLDNEILFDLCSS